MVAQQVLHEQPALVPVAAEVQALAERNPVSDGLLIQNASVSIVAEGVHAHVNEESAAAAPQHMEIPVDKENEERADAVNDFIDQPQGLELSADLKGKADVPIVQVGTSTDGPSKGMESFPLTNSPSLLDIQKLVENHALDIIDGAHLISEEGLQMWSQHYAPPK